MALGQTLSRRNERVQGLLSFNVAARLRLEAIDTAGCHEVPGKRAFPARLKRQSERTRRGEGAERELGRHTTERHVAKKRTKHRLARQLVKRAAPAEIAKREKNEIPPELPRRPRGHHPAHHRGFAHEHHASRSESAPHLLIPVKSSPFRA